METRGIRNCNPFNIRKSKCNNWKGKVKSNDAEFETFSNMYYGVRAGIVLLRNYIKTGHNTINKIIDKWAPTCENDTESYKYYISAQAEIGRFTTIDAYDKQTIWNIAKAMMMYESKYKAEDWMIDEIWSDIPL